MGITKRHLEEEEGKTTVAEHICHEADWLLECELCGRYCATGNEDDKLAYKIAASRVKERHATVEGFETQQELTDRIKQVMANNGHCTCGPQNCACRRG